MSAEEQDIVRQIIHGCLKKDKKSQEMLYRHFHDFAMRVCQRYSSSYEEAVEIMNDGFMKVFTKIKMYDHNLSFYGWMRRIMINTALNHFKKNKKHYYNYELEEAKNEISIQDAESKIAYEELLEMVQKLSPVYRAVFNLYIIDGYKHEEISRMLKITVGASKSNLSKARVNLRLMLQKKSEDEFAKYSR